jgi:hypothetical protein
VPFTVVVVSSTVSGIFAAPLAAGGHTKLMHAAQRRAYGSPTKPCLCAWLLASCCAAFGVADSVENACMFIVRQHLTGCALAVQTGANNLLGAGCCLCDMQG